MWWKANKWKIIVPAAVAVVLALAFWFGGSAPGQQGWQTPPPAVPEAPPAAAPEAIPGEAPSEPPENQPEPPAKSLPEPDLPPEPPAQPEPEAEPLPAAAPEPVTTPLPEETPVPEPPPAPEAAEPAHTCTLSISCASVLAHMDWLDAEKAELIPADGWVLPPTEVEFTPGESVFDVLQRTCQANKIHLEFSETPLYQSAYIEGVHNLYEFDCGELSGWVYKVNDWFPNYGCSRYQLQDGDAVCWLYTCDLGADVGGRNALG